MTPAEMKNKEIFRFLTNILTPLLAILFFLGCPQLVLSAAKAESSTESDHSEVVGPPVPAAETNDAESEIIPGPRFALYPAEVRPGEPVTVAYNDDFDVTETLQAILLDSQGKVLAKAKFFEIDQELKAAILAVPSTAVSGAAFISIESDARVARILRFTITGRDFISETIPLNQANTDLRTVPDPQKTAESDQLWRILSRTGTEIYSGSQFMPPVTSTRRTSFFGDRRVYRYTSGSSDTTIHAGIDFGVPTGTEVKACAAGKVVLARSRIVTGNSVVLEHLPGIYSLYYHMDRIGVSEGSIVEAGSLLGLSGSTGLATGPHLHWEIRVSGENADPDAFTARAVLDKKDILNKLTN